MQRREFLLAAAAVSLVPALPARGAVQTYEPGLIERLERTGRPVLVVFSTDWCSTCAAQERALEAIRKAEPALDGRMAFVRVDWDHYKGADFVRNWNIPRRSTLVVRRGGAELGRLVAVTDRAQIRALIAAGLAAT